MNLSLSRRLLFVLLAAPLMLSLCLAIFWSWGWPLVGDATLIHYVIFLIGKGLKPYRDIIDINLPGTYFFEALAMRLFGMGALAWRIYDLLLLGFIACAAVLIAGRRNAFAGVLAGLLFALIHIQDGLAQLGQRDLLISALLLWAYAALFKAQRGTRSALWIFCFGLLLGTTFTIKPTFVPLAFLLLFLSARSMLHRDVKLIRYILFGLSGLVFPCLAATLWLYRLGSLKAFVALGGTLIPLHASLGHRSLSYLVAHITSPIVPLCAAWLILLCLVRPKSTTERIELFVGIACAVFAYAIQGKGFPYHRYPFLTLVLVLMMVDFTDALMSDRWPRFLAIIALGFSCFAIAPRCAWLTRSFRPETPFQQSLDKQLQRFTPQLSGKVQCLDTFGGCVNSLYDLRLVQGTGYLYDCYLFTPRQNAITRKYRADFLEAYQQTQPRVLIVTDQLCFGDQGGFQKLGGWLEFKDDIERNYVFVTEWKSSVEERWWSRSEVPPGYRIYLRK